MQLLQGFVREFPPAVQQGLVLGGHPELVGDGLGYPADLVACLEFQDVLEGPPSLQTDRQKFVVAGAARGYDVYEAIISHWLRLFFEFLALVEKQESGLVYTEFALYQVSERVCRQDQRSLHLVRHIGGYQCQNQRQ